MKVFGIGLSRTGTKSLNTALRLIGFDVHHYPVDQATANEVIEGRPYSILERCDGLTDVHAAVRFRELDTQYPGSRFVLTLRDRRPWLDSCRRHFNYYRPEGHPLPLRDMILRLRHQAYGVAEFDEGAFSVAYDRHVASVLGHFHGRNDLLVLDITRGDGWDLICSFFERSKPAEPFPHIR